MPKEREMSSEKVIFSENQVFLNSFLSAGIKLCICNWRKYKFIYVRIINSLNAQLNPICNLLELLAHHILHVSRHNIIPDISDVLEHLCLKVNKNISCSCLIFCLNSENWSTATGCPTLWVHSGAEIIGVGTSCLTALLNNMSQSMKEVINISFSPHLANQRRTEAHNTRSCPKKQCRLWVLGHLSYVGQHFLETPGFWAREIKGNQSRR
jgi:hypothetical protein